MQHHRATSSSSPCRRVFHEPRGRELPEPPSSIPKIKLLRGAATAPGTTLCRLCLPLMPPRNALSSGKGREGKEEDAAKGQGLPGALSLPLSLSPDPNKPGCIQLWRLGRATQPSARRFRRRAVWNFLPLPVRDATSSPFLGGRRGPPSSRTTRLGSNTNRVRLHHQRGASTLTYNTRIPFQKNYTSNTFVQLRAVFFFFRPTQRFMVLASRTLAVE